MIHAYSDFYLGNTQRVLGNVFDIALNHLGYSLESFGHLLSRSAIMVQFGTGNPHFVAGLSGPELLSRIMDEDRADGTFTSIEAPPNTLLKSEGYWAGWALAYYQWYSARSFKTILQAVGIGEIVSMYRPYHEMDIPRFAEEMERRVREADQVPRLKTIRERCGLSQSQLAERSGVKLRMIQLYEQRQNNINKAQAITIARLAYALDCPMEELLDEPLWIGELMLDRKF